MARPRAPLYAVRCRLEPPWGVPQPQREGQRMSRRTRSVAPCGKACTGRGESVAGQGAGRPAPSEVGREAYADTYKMNPEANRKACACGRRDQSQYRRAHLGCGSPHNWAGSEETHYPRVRDEQPCCSARSSRDRYRCGKARCALVGDLLPHPPRPRVSGPGRRKRQTAAGPAGPGGRKEGDGTMFIFSTAVDILDTLTSPT